MPPNMSPALPSLQLVSHRCFRDPTEFQLRPLTLLYGRNQAGKSTLVRLLPLLADALRSNRGPIDMTSAALRGASFKELGWLGPNLESTQRLTFRSAETASRPAYAIRIDVVDEGRGPMVNRISVSAGGSAVLDVSWDGPDSAGTSPFAARYKGLLEGGTWDGELEFRSLFPESLPTGRATDALAALREAVRPIASVQWLQANRLPSARGTSTRPSTLCSADGSDLAVVLRRHPEVVASASAWLSGPEVALGELQLGQDSAGAPRFEVRSHAAWETLPLRLAGEGLRALLPVLLCACWAETKTGEAPGMLSMEEPEAQLHPRLQILLADRLFACATRGVPVVAETHSVYVLRALQRAVLKRRVAPEQVALYWVEQSPDGASRLAPVTVRDDAGLEGWPPGVLEEEQALAREIFDARWAREAEG